MPNRSLRAFLLESRARPPLPCVDSPSMSDGARTVGTNPAFSPIAGADEARKLLLLQRAFRTLGQDITGSTCWAVFAKSWAANGSIDCSARRWRVRRRINEALTTIDAARWRDANVVEVLEWGENADKKGLPAPRSACRLLVTEEATRHRQQAPPEVRTSSSNASASPAVSRPRRRSVLHSMQHAGPILSSGSRPAIAEAFEELVRTSGGPCWRWRVASSVTRRRHATRCRRPSYRRFAPSRTSNGHSHLSTWLHRIVVNASLMRLRTRQRRAEQSIEPLLPSFGEDGQHVEPVIPGPSVRNARWSRRSCGPSSAPRLGNAGFVPHRPAHARHRGTVPRRKRRTCSGFPRTPSSCELHRGPPGPRDDCSHAAGAAGQGGNWRPAGGPWRLPKPTLARRVAATWQDRSAGAAIPAVAM